MDNVDDMILVAEIAETGSFVKAGGQLGIPKSTVSQRVSQLEARLGLRLFNRSTRTIGLTSSGQVYLEYCRRVRSEIAAASMAMANLKDQPFGTLRITCPEVTASYFMPAFLAGLTRKFPRIAIDLMATNRHVDLIRERVDFAFRVGPVSNQDFIVRKLSTIKRILVSSPKYLSAADDILEPLDLEQHRCLVHDAIPEWIFTSGSQTVTVQPFAAAKSDSLSFLLQSTLMGTGVALLPAYICQPSLVAGLLVAVLPGWSQAPHDLTLIFPNRENQSKAHSAFRDYIDAYDFSPFATGRSFSEVARA